MSWLDPRNIRSPLSNAEATVSAFLEEQGQLGVVVLGAWNAVDPLHCFSMPDEYLGYAERFIELTTGTIPERWSDYPDLMEELVRRSFHPMQVCFNVRLGQSRVTAESIKSIARLITEGVKRAGIRLEQFDEN
jgi:hypothetical protein